MRLFTGFKLAKNLKSSSRSLIRNMNKLFASEKKDPINEKKNEKSESDKNKESSFTEKAKNMFGKSSQSGGYSQQKQDSGFQQQAQQYAEQAGNTMKEGANQAYQNLKDAPGLFKFFSTQMTSATNQPIDKLIYADHNFIKSLHKQVEQASSNEERNKWRNMLVYEIARHSIAEELILYPLFRSNLSKGEEYFQNNIAEHHAVKEKLISFQNLDVTDSKFNDRLKDVMDTLYSHIEKEENIILPELSKSMDQNTLISHGNQYARRKFIVPTRPHTIIPEDPPTLNSVLGILTAPIDKFRDIFTAYPEQDKVAELKKEACKEEKK